MDLEFRERRRALLLVLYGRGDAHSVRAGRTLPTGGRPMVIRIRRATTCGRRRDERDCTVGLGGVLAGRSDARRPRFGACLRRRWSGDRRSVGLRPAGPRRREGETDSDYLIDWVIEFDVADRPGGLHRHVIGEHAPEASTTPQHPMWLAVPWEDRLSSDRAWVVAPTRDIYVGVRFIPDVGVYDLPLESHARVRAHNAVVFENSAALRDHEVWVLGRYEYANGRFTPLDSVRPLGDW